MTTFAARSSRRRSAATTAMIVGFVVALGAGTASATGPDDKYLADLSQVNVPYQTPGQAIKLGKSVCQMMESGLSAGMSDDAIRGKVISNLQNTGLSGMEAHQLMGIAVANYCPQYFDVAGD